jgi:hypothetical protein
MPSEPKINFFMIVTDPDIYIADYAIRSYSRIKKIDFRLQIYSNYISPNIKKEYFPRWKKLGYVNLIANDFQDTLPKPTDTSQQGPFETCYDIWDRELQKIDSQFYAQADADFEILNPRFVDVMMSKLESNPKLGAISAFGTKEARIYFDTYSQEKIIANPRLNTAFCIYRRETSQSKISHQYHEEILDTGPVRRNTWDDSGYFQKSLKDNLGFNLEILSYSFDNDFIHYGAFSKNSQLNRKNLPLYRRIKLLPKISILGFHIPQKIISQVDRKLFGHIDRSHFWDKWNPHSTS